MRSLVAGEVLSRRGISLLALAAVIGAGQPAVMAQTVPQPQPASPTPPAQDAPVNNQATPPTLGNTPTAQTSVEAGPGIATSTVPQNETIAGPQPIDNPQGEEGQEILVTGVRQAEQTAIARKRTARTAQDSIVADDVGQFPDKNAAEAIARIAGVALDVGDDGQQGGFTIRGQSADLIRVEVDGMTALPANGDSGGRAVSISDISSDLIKSVDVIKGQTADMTPGGVGGTVRIEQRTGLDFAEPLYRLNVQGRYDTLNGKVAPRINAIATHKFFDDRLGVLLNATYEEQRLGIDTARVSNNAQGYLPYGDHDNSAEKSFTTPFDPIAAAVTNKADCAALPTTGINSRLNCYAQWEDFVPTQPRYTRGIRHDKRFSLQARVDFRATDDLVVFASYNPNIRKFDYQDYHLNIGRPSGSTNANGAISSNITNVAINENHYATQYDMVVGTGTGTVSSLDWGSQVRDIVRNIEQNYTQVGADWNPDMWTIKGRAQYSVSKYDRQDEAFFFYVPLPSATFTLIPENGLWNMTPDPSVDVESRESYYPELAADGYSRTSSLEYTPQADRNSEWNLQFDATREFDSLGPLDSIKFGVQHRRRDNNAYREGGTQILPGVIQSRARSLDLVRFCSPELAPADQPCEFGSTRRTTTAGTTDQLYKIHTLTEDQYQQLINATLMRIPGDDFLGGLPNRGDLLTSWMAFDSKKLIDMLRDYVDLSDHTLDCLYECIASDGQVYERPTYNTNERTTSAYAMADFSTDVRGVLIDGNVGVRYQRIDVAAQPVINFANRVVVERTEGLPGFDIQDIFVSRSVGDVQRTSEDWLPSFNLAVWPIEGELGLRYSIARQRARPSIGQVTGSGAVTCGIVSPEDRATLEEFLINNPGAIDDGNPDTGEGEEAGDLLSNFVNRCSGRIGNPQLKGYGAVTQNLSLEWYPNADTQLSAAIYSIDVNTGRPEDISLADYELEGNTYDVASYRDGPGGLTTKGFEIAGRTAFTFLPWILQYTGAGFNYSYSNTNQQNTEVDLFTGISLPPRNQSSSYYNINAWYDDGRLNARIAYQFRSEYYRRIDADGANRLPGGYGIDGVGNGVTSYFKHISPIFRNKIETLDARASYAINDHFQLFVEGKNLLDSTNWNYSPAKYRQLDEAGTPYTFDLQYLGRTYYFGVIATL